MSIRYRLRGLYWRLRPNRCECGYVIWPWQRRVWDQALGGDIHETCASYPDESDLTPQERADIEASIAGDTPWDRAQSANRTPIPEIRSEGEDQ